MKDIDHINLWDIVLFTCAFFALLVLGLALYNELSENQDNFGIVNNTVINLPDCTDYDGNFTINDVVVKLPKCTETTE